VARCQTLSDYMPLWLHFRSGGCQFYCDRQNISNGFKTMEGGLSLAGHPHWWSTSPPTLPLLLLPLISWEGLCCKQSRIISPYPPNIDEPNHNEWASLAGGGNCRPFFIFCCHLFLALSPRWPREEAGGCTGRSNHQSPITNHQNRRDGRNVKYSVTD
jgi:hypothetical protein